MAFAALLTLFYLLTVICVGPVLIADAIFQNWPLAIVGAVAWGAWMYAGPLFILWVIVQRRRQK